MYSILSMSCELSHINFPVDASGKESTCQCRRCKRRGFDPWVRKIPWRRKVASHLKILAWKIPWTEESGGLQAMGLKKVEHNWSDWALMHAFSKFSSFAQSCPTLCDPMDCSMPGLPAHHELPKLAQAHFHQVSDAIQPSHPLSSPSPPALNLSQHQGLFKWVSSSHQVAKILEFQLQHQPFQWIFRTDFLYSWLVGSLCSPRDSQSLLQQHSSKASVLWWLIFLYRPTLSSIHNTGKSIALTRWTFVGKVMSLLFNILSRLVITFLPRSKCLSISWSQSPSAVILEPLKIICHCFQFPHLFAMKWWDQMPWS